MNLSILLTDFIDTKGMLKTYRFIPINQYNRIVVDRLSDICTDVKGNTDKDVGLLRVYNSDKCQLLSTTCKIKDFTDSYGKIFFCFEHMFIPVESSRYGSCNPGTILRKEYVLKRKFCATEIFVFIDDKKEKAL